MEIIILLYRNLILWFVACCVLGCSQPTYVYIKNESAGSIRLIGLETNGYILKKNEGIELPFGKLADINGMQGLILESAHSQKKYSTVDLVPLSKFWINKLNGNYIYFKIEPNGLVFVFNPETKAILATIRPIEK
jgi:hypothetical protein